MARSKQGQDYPRQEQLPEVCPQAEKQGPIAKVTSPQKNVQQGGQQEHLPDVRPQAEN